MFYWHTYHCIQFQREFIFPKTPRATFVLFVNVGSTIAVFSLIIVFIGDLLQRYLF